MKKSVSKTTVQKLLICLGIAPNISGYGYLATAIMMKLECRPMGMCQIYRELGRCNGLSAASIERCMRFALVRGYNLNRFSRLNSMYNADIVSGLPMVSEFINYIVEYFYLFGDDDSHD